MNLNPNIPCNVGAPLLTIRDLRVEFNGLAAVDQVSLSVSAGEVLGIVGESGSGKSITAMALMGLIDPPGQVSANELRFNGVDLLHTSPAKRRRIVGKDIAMVFQDALMSLNPSYTVGFQIKEVLSLHEGLRGAALERSALDLLEQVGIPDAKNRINAFPHQMSGGMNQRVMIAMAVACNPKLLIADEPTTALDVTIQAQIMDLLMKLQKERGMALLLISHDLAVVFGVAQRIAVMYAGEIIEINRVPNILLAPHHPYTEALLAAIPEHNRGMRRLSILSGIVPGCENRPSGCLFAPRCKYVIDNCWKTHPALASIDARDEVMCVRCIRALNMENFESSQSWPTTIMIRTRAARMKTKVQDEHYGACSRYEDDHRGCRADYGPADQALRGALRHVWHSHSKSA
ncbi:ABC transporter ATP-binding protein [Candidatus Vallotia cooleyia]|uniref:ABC transporter ATP-binding protein n=1 Tax=Candidatus Vallotiella adelgis TaxID=1177211 RepID=UPI001D02D36A|nr:ABC transporter ATP-binding protein [Candidatus Vallotia cooleyia]UDG82573.1 Vitamin B12 import ATP-binding protein BtuD [Candidatus Vallotia cooleyia]